MAALPLSPKSFQTFGDLLKYLRRRERLTQLELSIAVGYSEAHVGRIEQNRRKPDPTVLKALFIPVLHLESEPELLVRFLELAEAARQEEAPAAGQAPYKGLVFFDQTDAGLFFGREALTKQLAARIQDLAMDSSFRCLAVVGASGSGKSSLLRAGLAPALQRGGWDVQVFTPNAHPLEILLQHFEAGAPIDGGPRLLLVDQFEETFTICRDEGERLDFIERLLSIARDPLSRTTVVIALRADFYSHCAKYPNLRRVVAAQQEYVGQMTKEELRLAIEEPAKRGDWELEPGLAELLLTDIGADGMGQPEPGALPLFSHALLATWERRRGRLLTIEGYRACGGVRGAIAQTAESVFTDQLNHTQQNLARDVFLRLTELGEGTEDTRRRAALNELVRQPDEAVPVRTVLNTLAGARLITLNEDSAEVAHESLIREWQRLHDWLTQDRDGLRLHRHLTEATREWEARGHDAAELYRGGRLAQVREWASANEQHLNAPERGFIAASMEQEQRDSLEREAQRRRELESAQTLAKAEQRRAEEQTRFAYQMRQRARYLTAAFAIAMILAGMALSFSNQSNQNALAVMNERATTVANADKTARLLNAMMGKELLTWSQQSSPTIPTAYSPDGRLKAARSGENAILISDASTSYPLVTLRGHTDQVTGIAFSPDGSRLVSCSVDGTAILWRVAGGQPLFTLGGNAGPMESAVFSPDGNYILTGADRSAIVWDATTGTQLLTLPDDSDIRDAAYSPDGTRIATAYLNGTARIWDATTGEELRTLSMDSASVVSVAFSPDGKWLVSVSADGTARVWNASTGEEMLDYVR